jgi:voltage-gated potassium channel Kch
MEGWRSPIRVWLAIVGTATLILGASYTMAQQSTRLAVNDLPIVTSETTAKQLATGSTAQAVVPAMKTDLRTEHSVFTIVTDQSQKVLASSATLDDKTPLPPKGVFDYTAIHGSDTFTWQPVSGVRLATHVVTYNGGFIITGQSLHFAENRIDTFGLLALAAWVATVIWAFLMLVGLDFRLLTARSTRRPKE